MGLAVIFEAGEGIQLDAVNGPKHAFFNVGVRLFQLPQQHLHLLALALPYPVAGSVPGFGKTAGTLEKLQVIVVLPGDDIVFMDAVQGTDQLHAGKILAVELGRHGLKLGAVKQPQKCGLDDIGKMMAQSDLIAAQLLRFGVQETPAHPLSLIHI